MLNSQLQMVMTIREIEAPARDRRENGTKWTWLAGRRYRSLDRN